LVAKQLELLHELVSRAARVAVFVNPVSVNNTEAIERDARPAARAMGLEIQFFRASSSREIDAISERNGKTGEVFSFLSSFVGVTARTNPVGRLPRWRQSRQNRTSSLIC
jgi:ABC-type uncharacterized transport system substrate-binding protein